MAHCQHDSGNYMHDCLVRGIPCPHQKNIKACPVVKTEMQAKAEREKRGR